MDYFWGEGVAFDEVGGWVGRVGIRDDVAALGSSIEISTSTPLNVMLYYGKRWNTNSYSHIPILNQSSRNSHPNQCPDH